MFIDGVDVIDLLDSSSAASASPQERRVTRSMKASVVKPTPPPEPKKARPSEPAETPNEPSALIQSWKSIEEQLRCDICKQLLDVPVSLKCFHTFCSFCIRRYLELSGNDYCPCCRVPATSTDIRLEPRLTGILKILGQDRGAVRKRIRHCITQYFSKDTISSANETFNKQADMVEMFRSSSSGDPIGRTLMPVYKSLKDKQLKELVEKDGLVVCVDNRDDLIRVHKEFIFTLQAAFDAVRMGLYQDCVPTKSGVAKVFNSDFRFRNRTTGRFVRGKSEAEIRRENADKNEAVTALAKSAQDQMKEQLRQAILRRKQRIAMFRHSYARRGDTLEKLMPGYKDKMWSRVPDDWKMRVIQYQNRGFEQGIEKHKNFQSKFVSYKKIEDKFVPSQQFRKPAVDWRRQLARGTLHIGRWFEGPNGSDYRPGKTFSRLDHLEPFSKEEWADRKKYRVWDGVKVGLGLWGLWVANRISSTTPVVWA